jgi:hypothetical protein
MRRLVIQQRVDQNVCIETVAAHAVFFLRLAAAFFVSAR